MFCSKHFLGFLPYITVSIKYTNKEIEVNCVTGSLELSKTEFCFEEILNYRTFSNWGCFLCMTSKQVDPWTLYCNVTFCLVNCLCFFLFLFFTSYVLIGNFFKFPGFHFVFLEGCGQEMGLFICYPFLYYVSGKLINKTLTKHT